MTPEQQEDIVSLMVGQIDEEEFLRRFPVDPRTDTELIRNVLETSTDEDEIEVALSLGFRFGFSPSWAPAFRRLLTESWHHSQEDIASALDELRDADAVDALYHAALMESDDEFYALAVKCLYALFHIGTPAAKEKLQLLAQSENPIIRTNAQEMVKTL